MLIDQREAAAQIGMAPATLQKWRALRQGPRYLKINRTVRYDPKDLKEWLAERRVNSGAEAV